MAVTKAKTCVPLMRYAVTAAAALTAHRFIDYAGNHAAAGERARGVTEYAMNSADVGNVVVLGTVLLELGGTVAAGDDIVSDANGKGVKATALSATPPAGATPVTSTGAQAAMTIAGSTLPQAICARAMEAGDNADIIEVMLVQ